jgi:hypothetical protein
MNVSVKMHGVLGRGGPSRASSFELALHDGATAGELMEILAEQCGPPFSDAVETSDARFPPHIRMFADGEMLSALGQPLVAACGRRASVSIVVLSPMMGG